MTQPDFKALVRDQYFMLLVDEQWALATLPGLAGRNQTEVGDMIGALRRVEAPLGVNSTMLHGDIRLIPDDAEERQPAGGTRT